MVSAAVASQLEVIKSVIAQESAEVKSAIVAQVSAATAELTAKIEELKATIERLSLEKTDEVELLDALDAIKLGVENIYVEPDLSLPVSNQADLES